MGTNSRSNLGWALTFLCVVAPFVLFVIPADRIYGGETLCLYTHLLGRSCWGCGITRALYAVLHLDFAEAWSFNKMVVVIAPITIYLWAREVWRLISWIKKVGERRM
ncbi:MAG: DUF2752 domain-containing protein [Rikenellaceae bacterium]